MADLFKESFEGAGYENSWSETVGSGNTVDEDHALPGTPPTGAGSSGLRCVLGGSNANAYSQHDMGGSKLICYVRAYIYVTSFSTADTVTETIFTLSGAVDNLYVRLRYASGTYRLSLNHYDSGPSLDHTEYINTGQWYLLEGLYDATNDLWEWKLDGVSKGNGSLSNARTDSQYVTAGFQTGLKVNASDIDLDLIAVSDSDWFGEESGDEYTDLSGSATIEFNESSVGSLVKSISGSAGIELSATAAGTATPINRNLSVATFPAIIDDEGIDHGDQIQIAGIYRGEAVAWVELAGVSGMAINGSGVASIEKALSGQADIEFTENTVASLVKSITGQADIVFTGAGAGGLVSAIAGQADIVFTGAGAGTPVRLLAGQADIEITASAAAGLLLALAGQADIEFSALASGELLKNLAGTAGIEMSATAVGAIIKELSGQADIVLTAAVAAGIIRALSGEADIVFTGRAETSIDGVHGAIAGY